MVYSIVTTEDIKFNELVGKSSLLRWTLKALQFVGGDPRFNTLYAKTMRCMNITGSCFIFLMSLFEVLFNWQGFVTVSKSELLPSLFQIITKVIWVQTKKTDILRALRKMSEFWTEEQFDTEVQIKIQTHHNKIKKVFKYYFAMTSVTVISLQAKAYMARKLVYPGYEYCSLATSPCFEINYIFQTIMTLFFVLPGVIGCDALFTVLILHIYCGFEMLEVALKKININQDESNIIKDISKIVDQHNVLLQFIKELNNVYSHLLLGQIWSSLTICIASLFLLTYEGIPPDLDHILKYGVLYVNVIFQCAVYCIGGTIVKEKTEHFSKVVYNTHWYLSEDINYRRSLILIIQRSNKRECITIGGLRILDLKALFGVMKNSLSIYTLMQSLRTSEKSTE